MIKAWSVDEERFDYLGLDELIDNHDELEVGHVVYFGDAVHPDSGDLIDADDVIETMGERAYDINGEYSYDYPSVTKDAKDELNKLLTDWITKHCPPTFYTVENVKEYTITEEDLGE
jgi:hypothetical protein